MDPGDFDISRILPRCQNYQYGRPPFSDQTPKNMSQNWRVIAPGRREMTGCIGQLIEGLVSGSATGLVPLLALPVSVHRLVIRIIWSIHPSLTDYTN